MNIAFDTASHDDRHLEQQPASAAAVLEKAELTMAESVLLLGAFLTLAASLLPFTTL